jgi:hypothetical protein
MGGVFFFFSLSFFLISEPYIQYSSNYLLIYFTKQNTFGHPMSEIIVMHRINDPVKKSTNRELANFIGYSLTANLQFFTFASPLIVNLLTFVRVSANISACFR